MDSDRYYMKLQDLLNLNAISNEKKDTFLKAKNYFHGWYGGDGDKDIESYKLRIDKFLFLKSIRTKEEPSGDGNVDSYIADIRFPRRVFYNSLGRTKMDGFQVWCDDVLDWIQIIAEHETKKYILENCPDFINQEFSHRTRVLCYTIRSTTDANLLIEEILQNDFVLKNSFRILLNDRTKMGIFTTCSYFNRNSEIIFLLIEEGSFQDYSNKYYFFVLSDGEDKMD